MTKEAIYCGTYDELKEHFATYGFIDRINMKLKGDKALLPGHTIDNVLSLYNKKNPSLFPFLEVITTNDEMPEITIKLKTQWFFIRDDK